MKTELLGFTPTESPKQIKLVLHEFFLVSEKFRFQVRKDTNRTRVKWWNQFFSTVPRNRRWRHTPRIHLTLQWKTWSTSIEHHGVITYWDGVSHHIHSYKLKDIPSHTPPTSVSGGGTTETGVLSLFSESVWGTFWWMVGDPWGKWGVYGPWNALRDLLKEYMMDTQHVPSLLRRLGADTHHILTSPSKSL